MPWWIATTSPACERRAETGLADAGFEVWSPLEAYEVKKSSMPRPEWRCRRMYPGYVFVNVGDEPAAKAWHIVRSCEGVLRPLLADGLPFELSDDEMSALAAGFVCSLQRMVEDAWRIGDAAIVTDGPFLSLRARISDVLRRDRLKADIEIMGRWTTVEMRAAQLERA